MSTLVSTAPSLPLAPDNDSNSNNSMRVCRSSYCGSSAKLASALSDSSLWDAENKTNLLEFLEQYLGSTAELAASPSAEAPNCRLADLQQRSVLLPSEQAFLAREAPWLDQSKDFIRQFAQLFGTNLGAFNEHATYYVMSQTGENGIKAATRQLHRLFLEATGYALLHQRQFQHNFVIPDKLWPLLHASWQRQQRDVVAARFDLAITDAGLKVYEYNADSASGLLENSHIQGRWGDAAGVGSVGRDVGATAFAQLVETWRAKGVQGVLHILCDVDGEEQYHALYMKAAAEAAGIRCKMLAGQPCGWNFAPDDGRVLDADGLPMANIWKSWSWRTVVDSVDDGPELDRYLELASSKPAPSQQQLEGAAFAPGLAPKLFHALLDPRARVFEPLWTMLPASKAILPILWQLHPRHPYLIASSYTLTPELQQSGYVSKPASGRAGKSIGLFGPGSQGLVEATQGQWDDGDKMVYQELCSLPKFGDQYVQINPWVIGGEYGGIIIRHSTARIIDYCSSVDALRIVGDDELRQQ